MTRFTKELRQQIVKEFALRHNGVFNPTLFLEHVRETGPEHPAFEWFEWDQNKAALNYQIEQARSFARDLRVSFTVEEVGRSEPVRVRQAAMPLVLSPMEGRKDGGGYVLVNPDDPAHMIEHCQQAAIALRAWQNRYKSALLHAGGSPETLEEAIRQLEATKPQQLAAE
ncbi:hypothetical protein [Microvirga zambiensis]|uniref:hypothetical protein n=1 Tax=Microvirga zambiensis TaxID=1402137 RepID=UPI00191E173C|nr:hypothetical protein [Microvirga zambiensis]